VVVFLGGAAGVAWQWLRAEKRAADEHRRLVALRGDCQELLRNAQREYAWSDWPQAQLELTRTLAKIGSEPELADLRAHAADLLTLTHRQLDEQARRDQDERREAERRRVQLQAIREVQQFRLKADEMHFYAASTDPLAEPVPYYDLRNGVAAGQAALAMARAWGPGLERLPLAAERERGKAQGEPYHPVLPMVPARL